MFVFYFYLSYTIQLHSHKKIPGQKTFSSAICLFVSTALLLPALIALLLIEGETFFPMLGADWTNGPPEQTKGRAAYRRPGNWDTRPRFSPLQIFSGFTENMLLTRREQQSLLKPTPEAISKIYFPGAAGPWSTMSE